MKRGALFIPFVTAAGSFVGVVMSPTGGAKSAFIIVAFLSVAACWLVVPLLSRRSLALGYLGLLLPIAFLVVAALLDDAHLDPRVMQVEASSPAGGK